MVFLGKIKKLAQKLQSGTFLVLLAVFFIFPISGLMADAMDLPVIIPNDELLTPVELRDGLVYEVVVTPQAEMATNDSSLLENGPMVLSHSSLSSDYSAKQNVPLKNARVVLATKEDVLSKDAEGELPHSSSVFEKGSEHFSVKSIASPGLFGFLGICLSRSELPSKNFSTPCENSLPKSMTRRSANDWKFSWQPVRTTSLWRMSTSSFRMQKTSILRPSQSRIPNTFDTSSTWSNAMAESPTIFWLEKKTEHPIALVQNPLKNLRWQLVPKANEPQQNPQLL
ncbi:hypothetical protein CLV96_3000 [Leptospira meyeri]|uniref:Uncharacterized protein n=1 Tax=Leptospira meyeri TaxID=29508 RepID=A0A4R8MRV6_LEPME|nr:hypothetical protein LEP1GSC017_0236 [Leptospira meyeri serovar Hardjo str. Went 5]TDY68486.1 hypothetical protein CLV96_3000 [Leptospira meyeri]